MEPLIGKDNNRRIKVSTKPQSWPAIAYNTIIRFMVWSFFGYIVFLSVVDVQEGKGLFSWHPPLLAFSVSVDLLCCFNEKTINNCLLTSFF